MCVTESGMVMVESVVQPAKAEAPMYVTSDGIVIDASFVQL